MNTKVQGSVFSNEMQIIPNANIEVVGENKFTTADASGQFEIYANSENSMLKFSHVGFDYDTISVAEFKQLGYIELYPTSLDGDFVVYNNYKKPDNTFLWIMGILAAVTVAAVVVTEVKIQKVKA